jgi:cob(I)alamin adenosyltransferase
MGNRLTRIVTRTGDGGSTGLGDGSRVGKDALRVHAMGDLDELNSALGCVLAEELPAAVRAALAKVQNDLFDLGGEICIPGREAMAAAQLQAIDAHIAAFNAPLPALREFVLPGGSRAAAACHLARAVARRAERSLAALARAEGLSPLALPYANRLSDLLFVCARTINHAQGQPETMWNPGAPTNRA